MPACVPIALRAPMPQALAKQCVPMRLQDIMSLQRVRASKRIVQLVLSLLLLLLLHVQIVMQAPMQQAQAIQLVQMPMKGIKWHLMELLHKQHVLPGPTKIA